MKILDKQNPPQSASPSALSAGLGPASPCPVLHRATRTAREIFFNIICSLQQNQN